MTSDDSTEKQQFQSKEQNNESKFTKIDKEIDNDEFEETQIPYCPKCGAKMVLRTATRGRYEGNKFWGCLKYPNCTGLLTI